MSTPSTEELAARQAAALAKAQELKDAVSALQSSNATQAATITELRQLIEAGGIEAGRLAALEARLKSQEEELAVSNGLLDQLQSALLGGEVFEPSQTVIIPESATVYGPPVVPGAGETHQAAAAVSVPAVEDAESAPVTGSESVPAAE